MAQMLARRKGDGNSRRYFESENMLVVLRCSRRIAMLPLRKDLEYVRNAPVAHATVCTCIDSRFFGELADRRVRKRFTGLNASRHRLPMVRIVGALDQQYLELWRINDD